jgi:hypothetical protein
VGKKYQNNKADTSQPAVPEQVSVALGELVGEVGEGLLALVVGTGLQVLSAMMEADVTAACGVALSGCSASGVAGLSSPGMWLCGDLGQAAAGTPTASFQAVNRVFISWR